MSDSSGISIVIPAYNEELRLPPFLRRLIADIKSFKREIEILVVDDGSIDGTEKVALQLNGEVPISVLKHSRNLGKGAAVRTGVLASRFPISVMIDADGAYGANEIIRGVEALERDSAAIAIGSRAAAGSTVNRPLWRRLGSRVFNLLTQKIAQVPLEDTQCGCKVFLNRELKPIFEKSDLRGFGFDVELLARAIFAGLKIVEFPVHCVDAGGSSLRILPGVFDLVRTLRVVRKLKS